MKIAIASDLHLEFEDINLTNDEGAQVLVLAGDILIAAYLHDHQNPNEGKHQLARKPAAAIRFRQFIKRVSDEFPNVVVIAGNHEHYHGYWKASIEHLRKEYDPYPNVHFLERDCKVIDDVTFIGGTLWTNCNKGDPMTLHALTGLMADFDVIRNDDLAYGLLKPHATESRHYLTLDYFKHVVKQNADNKVVIVSHHAPCSLSIGERYRSQFLMNGGYYSDLSEFILDHPQIKLWAHGHMHDKSDYVIGETRVVCNPRGYPKQIVQPYQLQYVTV